MLTLNLTAPRLLKSIYSYDPRHKGNEFAQEQITSSCDHSFATKLDQSHIPEDGKQPNAFFIWNVAATCQKCRIRFNVEIELPSHATHCPTERDPFHIFTETSDRLSDDSELFFTCLIRQCGACARVEFKPPILDPNDLNYLALQTNLAGSKEQDGDVKRPTLYQNLRTLRVYINGSLQSNEEKHILTTNPRLLGVFGTGLAANALMTKIGFTLDESSEIPAWIPPRPQTPEERNELFDLSEELLILLRNRPKAEQNPPVEPYFDPPPNAQYKDVQSIFGLDDYEKFAPVRRTLRTESQPGQKQAYAHLGVLPDFSDRLVLWAFQRLLAVADHSDRPQLLQSLKDVAILRQSEQLNLELVTLESQGMKTSGEIVEAYQILGIDPAHSGLINDLSIIGAYKSRLPDVNAVEQQKMRTALRVIAEHRHSDSLRREASGTIETYEQAMEWLEVPDQNLDDDFIMSLMAIKAEESPESELLARKAVELIAAERNSDRLRALLAGKDPPKKPLTLEEAYEVLGCQSFHDIDDGLLMDSYNSGITDNPSQKERLRDALSVIANERQSLLLQACLDSDTALAAPRINRTNPQDPRGLQNIGNTCYLNSLLQYFFTIKPVRELVSDFHHYSQHTGPGVTFRKKVDNVEVKMNAIVRAQDFVHELGKLFSQLVTSSDAFVIPEDNLARLTLVNVVDETVRRRSTIGSTRRPTLVDYAVQPSSDAKPLTTLIESEITQTVVATTGSDDMNMVDSEDNMEIFESPIAANSDGPEMKGAISSTVTADPDPMISEQKENATATDQSGQPNATGATNQRAEYEEFARQQDVREVIQNVLGQLRWSIRAEGMDKDGEQIDLISRLFYGKENYVNVTETGEESKIQPFFDIWVYFTAGSCDIYEALDGTFDKDIIEGVQETTAKTSQYRTITEIPPILQISVSRVNFDTQTARTYKIEDQLRLHETICMDRYCAEPEMLDRRKQSWQFKTDLRRLRARREELTKSRLNIDLADTIDLTREYLKSLPSQSADLGLSAIHIDDDLLQTLDDVVTDINNEIADIDAEIIALQTKLSDLFKDTGRLMYRLHAVFVHRGNARAGHWFIYLFDPASQIWRNYNDETVTPISDIKSVFEPIAANHGTSSFVVYVRDDYLDKIVDTVKRDPVTVTSPEPAAS